METAPAVLWDALVIFDVAGKTHPLADSGHAIEFLKDQYRHCKPIMLIGNAHTLLAKAGIPIESAPGRQDPGLILMGREGVERAEPRFADAIAKHRHFGRETDPPRV